MQAWLSLELIRENTNPALSSVMFAARKSIDAAFRLTWANIQVIYKLRKLVIFIINLTTCYTKVLMILFLGEKPLVCDICAYRTFSQAYFRYYFLYEYIFLNGFWIFCHFFFVYWESYFVGLVPVAWMTIYTRIRN